eukprot:scaffold2022_cov387-Prasinococcus_capsulatus_cf.AAC.1
MALRRAPHRMLLSGCVALLGVSSDVALASALELMLGREATARHYRARVSSMDAYDATQLPSEGLVIFVASTTGQGECPDNMKGFWRFLLRKSLPRDSLSRTRIAVFGLGDSSYPKFNIVAKKLVRRLVELGAIEVLPRGLGDDQHPTGVDAVLTPWVAKCWQALREMYPLPEGLVDPEPDAVLELGEAKLDVRYAVKEDDHTVPQRSAYKVSVEEAAMARQILDTLSCLSSLNKPPAVNPHTGVPNTSTRHRPCMATVKRAEALTTSDSPVEVRHLSLVLEELTEIERNDSANYKAQTSAYHEPGDVVGVVPPVSADALEEFLTLCGLNPDTMVQIRQNLQLSTPGYPNGSTDTGHTGRGISSDRKDVGE